MRRLLFGLMVSAGVVSIAQYEAIAQTTPTQQPLQPNQGFLGRLLQAYADEFNPVLGSAEGEVAATRRPSPFPPAPVASPPYPFIDWPYGGTPTIGAALPNSSGGNLMKALAASTFGGFLADNNIEIYGWLEPGVNLSTSSVRKAGNLPAGYDYLPNSMHLNQAVVYIERVPNTVQTDHIDWGFRVAGLYGTDYRFITMNGVFSNQLLKQNHQYGYDLSNFYFDLYIPWIGQGTDIRFGRYISLPDIEAQLAPNNYFFSHSLLYTYDPFTQFGLVASTQLNANWLIQVGISASNDNAPWTSSAKPSPLACVRWNSDSSDDNVYLCDNGTNDGRYGYNNVQLYVLTWYHKFSPRWHMAWETYYEYETQVPRVSTIPGANPALCHSGTRCYAPTYASVHYLLYQASDNDFIGFRNEVFNDERGQRTGFKSLYTEHTVSWSHFLSKSVVLRPEIRFEHSYDAKAYNSGKANSQLTLAADMIIKY
jgi:hypothetical protein